MCMYISNFNILTTANIDLTPGPSGLYVYATLNTLNMKKEKKRTHHQAVNKNMMHKHKASFRTIEFAQFI